MDRMRKCDCYDCKFFHEVFIDEFDEYWMYCRKDKCVISSGMRATCDKGVKKREGSDN